MRPECQIGEDSEKRLCPFRTPVTYETRHREVPARLPAKLLTTQLTSHELPRTKTRKEASWKTRVLEWAKVMHSLVIG